MAAPIHDKIKRSLEASAGLYYRLALLVGESGSGKTGILRGVTDEFGTSVINVNLTLSSRLVAKARDRWYVPDPSKEGDIEKVRDKALLKEFKEYKETKKRLRIFRIEAVRAGFKEAWQARDYDTIVAVAKKIPNNVLEGDPKLLLWYDLAVTRTGGE